MTYNPFMCEAETGSVSKGFTVPQYQFGMHSAFSFVMEVCLMNKDNIITKLLKIPENLFCDNVFTFDPSENEMELRIAELARPESI
jgi:hypothetical protein